MFLLHGLEPLLLISFCNCSVIVDVALGDQINDWPLRGPSRALARGTFKDRSGQSVPWKLPSVLTSWANPKAQSLSISLQTKFVTRARSYLILKKNGEIRILCNYDFYQYK